MPVEASSGPGLPGWWLGGERCQSVGPLEGGTWALNLNLGQALHWANLNLALASVLLPASVPPWLSIPHPSPYLAFHPGGDIEVVDGFALEGAVEERLQGGVELPEGGGMFRQGLVGQLGEEAEGTGEHGAEVGGFGEEALHGTQEVVEQAVVAELVVAQQVEHAGVVEEVFAQGAGFEVDDLVEVVEGGFVLPVAEVEVGEFVVEEEDAVDVGLGFEEAELFFEGGDELYAVLVLPADEGVVEAAEVEVDAGGGAGGGVEGGGGAVVEGFEAGEAVAQGFGIVEHIVEHHIIVEGADVEGGVFFLHLGVFAEQGGPPLGVDQGGIEVEQDVLMPHIALVEVGFLKKGEGPVEVLLGDMGFEEGLHVGDFAFGLHMAVLDVPALYLYVEVGEEVAGVGDAAAVAGFFEEAFHLIGYAAAAGNVAGFDELLEFDDFEVEDVLMVGFGFVFDAFEGTQGLHVHAFAVENAGEVDLLVYENLNIALDVEQAEALEELLVEVAFVVGEVAGGNGQGIEDGLVVVGVHLIEEVEELHEGGVALIAAGVELEVALFGPGHGLNEVEQVVTFGV